MKLQTLLISSLLFGYASTATAVDLSSLSDQLTKAPSEKVESAQSNALVSYAAKELGMDESTISAGLGSLFNVAKDNINADNFSTISDAIPGLDSLMALAPAMGSSSSSLTSLLGDSGKTASGLAYLDSAFKKVGLSTDQIPMLMGSVTSYLDQNGYSEASSLLKQGLKFL